MHVHHVRAGPSRRLGLVGFLLLLLTAGELPMAAGSQGGPVELAVVPRYEVVELTFTGPVQTPASDPWQIPFWVRLSHESGETSRPVYGFWDGDGAGGTTGAVFRVRFTPTRTGRWTLVEINTAGFVFGGPAQGSWLTVTSEVASRGFWMADPASPGGRWYRRSDGSHPYIVGNTHYDFLFAPDGRTATEATIRGDIADNAPYFNKVRFCLMSPRPANRDPQLKPFFDANGNPTDTETDRCNPRFFRERVDPAVREGFLRDVICDLILAGTEGDQIADREGFLKYVAARYGAYPNVWLTIGQEWDEQSSAQRQRENGARLQNYLAFPVPVSTHGLGGWRSALNGDWHDHTIRQGKIYVLATAADALLSDHAAGGGQPAINDENGYDPNEASTADVIEGITGSLFGGGYGSTGHKTGGKAGGYFWGHRARGETIAVHPSRLSLGFLRHSVDLRLRLGLLQPTGGSGLSIFTGAPSTFRALEAQGVQYVLGSNRAASVSAVLPPGTWEVRQIDVSARTDILLQAAVSGTIAFQTPASRAALTVFTRQVTDTTPVLTTETLPTAVIGVDYDAQLAVTDGDPPLSFNVGGSLPAGLILNADTGRLTGRPAGPAGAVVLRFEVVDADGDRSGRDLTVSVVEGAPAPPPGLTARAVSAAAIQLQWEDAGARAVGYEVQRLITNPAQPLEVTLTAYRGAEQAPTIEGPTRPDRFRVGARQANDRTATFTQVPTALDGLTRLLAARQDRAAPPTATKYEVALSTGGEIYAVLDGRYAGGRLSSMGPEWTSTGWAASTTDGESNPWSVWRRTVPAAGTIALGADDSAQRNGVVYVFKAAEDSWQTVATLPAATREWTEPGLAASTLYRYRVRALASTGAPSDWAGPVSATTATAGTVPQVSTATLPEGTAGQEFAFALVAAGGDGGLVWGLAPGSNALPSGLTLLPSGLLTGVPPAAGEFTFTVQVTDGDGDAATRLLSWTVRPPEDRPRIRTVSADLDQATVNRPYADDLEADGGTAPLTWSLAAGALPPGLQIENSLVTGTPTVAGTFTFTVRVTDANGQSDERVLQIEVGAESGTVVFDADLRTGATGPLGQVLGGTFSGGWQASTRADRIIFDAGYPLANGLFEVVVAVEGNPVATLEGDKAVFISAWETTSAGQPTTFRQTQPGDRAYLRARLPSTVPVFLEFKAYGRAFDGQEGESRLGAPQEWAARVGQELTLRLRWQDGRVNYEGPLGPATRSATDIDALRYFVLGSEDHYRVLVPGLRFLRARLVDLSPKPPSPGLGRLRIVRTVQPTVGSGLELWFTTGRGFRYFLETSGDLVRWLRDESTWRVGNGDEQSFNVPTVGPGPTYWRVVEVP